MDYLKIRFDARCLIAPCLSGSIVSLSYLNNDYFYDYSIRFFIKNICVDWYVYYFYILRSWIKLVFL